MKKLLLLAVIFGLLFASTEGYSKEKAKAKAKAAKPMVGTVISLTDLAKGGTGKIKRDEAEKSAEAGNPMVYMVGTGKSAKIYFVMNSDGTFAGKKLAKYAHITKLGIEGTVKTINGVNVIMADKITPMD